MDRPSWVCAAWLAGIPIASYIDYVVYRVHAVRAPDTGPVQVEFVFVKAILWPLVLGALCFCGLIMLISEVAGWVLARPTDALVNRIAGVEAKPQNPSGVLLRAVDGGKERNA